MRKSSQLELRLSSQLQLFNNMCNRIDRYDDEYESGGEDTLKSLQIGVAVPAAKTDPCIYVYQHLNRVLIAKRLQLYMFIDLPTICCRVT